MEQFLQNLFGQNNILVYISMAVPPLIFMIAFALAAVYMERKVSAHMQDRLGPMLTGWHGVIQTVADIVKLLQKEDIIPAAADRKLFILAPFVTFIGSYAAYACIPFSSQYVGSSISLGLFFIIAISSLVSVGLLMAGWGSNNKYSLYGAIRSVAQIISYEIPTVLVILTIVILAGTIDLQAIVTAQGGWFWNWYIFGGPGGWEKLILLPLMLISFIIYYVTSLAETNRTPFDIPEAESELVAGYHTEYSGMRFAFFFLSEYANMFAVSAIAASLFFGGWQSPFGDSIPFLNTPVMQFAWFLLKGLFFIFVQMWLRWTLPRLRVDQLMYVCWKVLIPFAFVNLLAVALYVVLK
ncbi:MAG: NADH-quinone oxidoreductase subunit NuoH [Ignavibacteriae bacterium]|nr:MAG: NADH-quinone oxidoreductase subunit NuoH [Ignavibacteriota bacterium]